MNDKTFKKIGDWNKVKLLCSIIGEEMQKSEQLCLQRFGLKAEALAKTHLSLQDLKWTALKPATIARKVRNGHSENILIQTSTYFQSITSWVEGETAYVGVKKTARSGGEDLANIARVQEFGSKSRNIPARPLWKPVWDEAMVWVVKHNSPVDIFMKRIEKYNK